MTGARFWTAAAAIHLGIAALYAPHIPIEPLIPNILNRALTLYGSLTGARAHFDFFAPTVAPQARLEFRVRAPDGSEVKARLATPSGEVNNRIAMMLTFFAYRTEREALLEAWGRYALGLFPEAVEIETRIEVLEIPALGARLDGEPLRWSELGRGTVRRGAHPGR